MNQGEHSHIVSSFDNDLAQLERKVLEMGGLAEAQLRDAMEALVRQDTDAAEGIIGRDSEIDECERKIEASALSIIARRQPTARDLRLLIAVSKTIANLERVGDEAARIARTVQRLINTGVSTRLRLPVSDLGFEAELAIAQLRKALDAFARLDIARALEVLKQDDQIDQEFDGLMRKLITYMMEDPRTISSSIDLVFVAKAIERVGDHGKNLAEAIIYVVKGTDVRHTSMEDVENAVR
jgi:phosphate transport system protein